MRLVLLKDLNRICPELPPPTPPLLPHPPSPLRKPSTAAPPTAEKKAIQESKSVLFNSMMAGSAAATKATIRNEDQEHRDDPTEYLHGAVTAASSVNTSMTDKDMDYYMGNRLRPFWHSFVVVCHEKGALDWGPEDYSQPNPPHENVIDIVFSSTCHLEEDPE
ncbi:MAG: hypothetical protein J3R72DRAFT_489945 [Linnemannia gamsii]|nr:MAG: hypothetical protein J3R72DRAFT_489945 [Linnemannia gamsii]